MATFYLKTLGCKVNQYDSQIIREQFLNRGVQEVGLNDNPDICIVNTCCVTNRAQAKGRNYINHLRRQYPRATLVVTGCTVDYQPESIDGKADFLVTNQGKSCLVNIFTNGEKNYGNKGIPRPDVISVQGIFHFTNRTRAFVKIQDGCNEFCSYCILPYVRGRSRSRDLGSVITEAKRLVHNGYREIVLVGIHLGDYGKDRGKTDELVELLEKLEKIPHLLRIRLSSLEPQDITAGLIDKVAESQKICHHFHIPSQSGDSIILKRMNRRYTYEEYRNLVNMIVSRIPEVTFTTDIMVGFPGETEEQFLNSCRAVEEVSFVKVHIFPYSVRQRTAATEFSNRVSSWNVKNRVRILQKITHSTALKIKEKLVGSFQWVLVEKSGRNPTGYTPTPKSLVWGYTSGYIPMLIYPHTINSKSFGVGVNSIVLNTLVKVGATGVKGQYLIGEKI